ncbi:hypothetical protein I546_2715 [Mycobacterium kansasii 732]|nr:hypothetical protein I546_2715 [Mycobacterium kansasii 732]
MLLLRGGAARRAQAVSANPPATLAAMNSRLLSRFRSRLARAIGAPFSSWVGSALLENPLLRALAIFGIAAEVLRGIPPLGKV